MSKDILVVPDPHAHPDHNNDRADWLGELIMDLKPDEVVQMGDLFDMRSLSSYDKGKASFHGASYEKDINAGVEFQDRMWKKHKKSKKKRPKRTALIGNHEQRLHKVLEYQPELGGSKYGVGFSDFQLENYNDTVVPYKGQTPGIYTSQGFNFAHYMVSGVMGRAIGGEHHAHSLIAKTHSSCVVAHSHLADWSVTTTQTGKTHMAFVAGVYQDYQAGWAGNVCKLWYPCVLYLRNAEDGRADHQFISLSTLRREYGK